MLLHDQKPHLKRPVSLIFLFCLALAATAARQEPKKIPPRDIADGDRYTVYRIELREQVDGSSAFMLHRAIQAAKAANADAVILDMNTPGGRLDHMMQMRDDLVRLEMPTYTYVNPHAISAGALLAIAMDKIVMAPISSIGASQIISATGQDIPEKMERKFTSALKGEVRSTAKYKGYPVQICEAFVDSEIEIPGLVPKGEVLTMDQEQATTVLGLVDQNDPTSSRTLASFIARDIEELLQKEGIWPANIVEYQMTWSELLAKFLLSIKPLLLLIGLAALYIEVKTPGVGIPGAIGVLALALFFWGSYLADLSGYLEILLFIAGMVLIFIEIFVIPGFGIAGVLGLLCIFVSLILAMVKLPSPDIPEFGFNADRIKYALWTVIFVFAGFIPLIFLLAKVLPATPLYRFLVLNPDAAVDDATRQQMLHPVGLSLEKPIADHELLGMSGEAITDLRPAGTARIGGAPIDVITRGEYIEKGNRVRVIGIQGPIHIVESLPKAPSENGPNMA